MIARRCAWALSSAAFTATPGFNGASHSVSPVTTAGSTRLVTASRSTGPRRITPATNANAPSAHNSHKLPGVLPLSSAA